MSTTKRSPATPPARRQRNRAVAPPPAPDAGLQHDSSKPKRVVGRPWPKGKSGNPSGKRTGTVSPTAALKRVLTRADAERIARRVIALAEKGDPTALRVLFDRLDHPLNGPLALQMMSSTTSDNQIALKWPHEMNSGMVVVHSPIDPEEVTGPAPPPDLTAAEWKRILELCRLPDGSTILRKGDEFIPTLPKATVEGNGAGDGPAPAAPPAVNTAAAPAPAAQPTPPPPPDNGRPAGRSFSEVEIFGTPEQRAEELAERTAPRFHRPRRTNPFLG